MINTMVRPELTSAEWAASKLLPGLVALNVTGLATRSTMPSQLAENVEYTAGLNPEDWPDGQNGVGSHRADRRAAVGIEAPARGVARKVPDGSVAATVAWFTRRLDQPSSAAMGYLAVFLYVALESVGIPLRGETA
jgi:hypothetical protein